MKNVTIYTDGACTGNPGPGGYGVVMLYEGHRKELSGGFLHTTNNRMEIFAVIRGLELLNQPCKVNLYSDSRYVVDAIEKHWLDNWIKKNWVRKERKPVLNVDLWKRVSQLLNVHQVKFIWVKGHAANPENERCDYLARTAIEKGELVKDEGYSPEDE